MVEKYNCVLYGKLGTFSLHEGVLARVKSICTCTCLQYKSAMSQKAAYIIGPSTIRTPGHPVRDCGVENCSLRLWWLSFHSAPVLESGFPRWLVLVLVVWFSILNGIRALSCVKVNIADVGDNIKWWFGKSLFPSRCTNTHVQYSSSNKNSMLYCAGFGPSSNVEKLSQVVPWSGPLCRYSYPTSLFDS